MFTVYLVLFKIPATRYLHSTLLRAHWRDIVHLKKILREYNKLFYIYK